MKWYLAKIVFRIICGNGEHTAQFDEQLRLVAAEDIKCAFEKAMLLGKKEQENFMNNSRQMVQWKFINISELLPLCEMTDGAELYSRIHEADDCTSYLNAIEQKAKYIAGENELNSFQLL